MEDINKRKRDNDTGEAVGTVVGAFPGDTMASALDPFGSIAGVAAGRALDNKTGESSVDDDNQGSIIRD
jgi:hypothetical protein